MFKTENLYQNDPLWKDKLLGFSPSVTIGSWGCLMTSATMVVNGMGFKETPLTMNEKMRGVGGFNGAAFFPSYVPAAFPGVVYGEYVDCEKTTAPLERIDAALAAGKPVVVCVDWNPQAGIQTHWVVLKDKKNNNYTMYDPYMYKGDSPSKDLILTDRYKYQGTDPAKAILAVIFFDSQVTTPVDPPKPVNVPADSLTVYAQEEGLSFRAEPNVAAFRYKTLALNTALTCLEAKADVRLKLGVNGQWLHVQDPAGQQGFVAAWYVSDTKKGAAAAQPPDSSKFETSPAIPAASVLPIPADSLTVLVIEEGLSFRAAPNLSAARLKSLSLNTALVTLEGGAVAKSKVGVNGQWLHVQDSTGLQGYVAAWYVADKKASIPAASIPAAAAVTAVTPTENNVMFRTKPLVSAETQIRQLASTETLTLLDAPALVTARLGKQGEWMKVRDAQNKEGYVAAWLLKAAATSAASPAEQPISSMAVTARTTADQVALRNQPKVADNNLIKRLPQGSIVTITETGGAEKIGKQDQWVRVKDAQGVEGYLAAWYLAR